MHQRRRDPVLQIQPGSLLMYMYWSDDFLRSVDTASTATTGYRNMHGNECGRGSLTICHQIDPLLRPSRSLDEAQNGDIASPTFERSSADKDPGAWGGAGCREETETRRWARGRHARVDR